MVESRTSNFQPPTRRSVTTWITDKSFEIRSYERGFKTMKTFDFNPRICHTYAARACNPCISNTYEKHGGGGSPLLRNSAMQSSISGGNHRLVATGCHSEARILGRRISPSVLFGFVNRFNVRRGGSSEGFFAPLRMTH